MQTVYLAGTIRTGRISNINKNIYEAVRVGLKLFKLIVGWNIYVVHPHMIKSFWIVCAAGRSQLKPKTFIILLKRI